MGLLTWIFMIGVICLLIWHYSPNTWESIKDITKDIFIKETTQTQATQNQDIITPDGQVVSPTGGKNFGKPYYYYDCQNNANCRSFSITAKCNNQTGECYQP